MKKQTKILVSIVIVLALGALLVSMLTPALSRARESACMNPHACRDACYPALEEDAYYLPEQLVEAEFNTEAYDRIVENPFLAVTDRPLSTFSIDVDTASYANIRRFLTSGQLPPKDAVRIEEMINYFSYSYPDPADETPFSVHTDVAECPWAKEHRLVRIGIKGREIVSEHRPICNLVFLIDVSGSMMDENKLPLLKRAMTHLVDGLTPRDQVAMVVYAGASGCVLESTVCTPKGKRDIIDALERLEAGGSTHGSAGIQLAYQTAIENFVVGGANRVILATDGDFNVGVTSQGDLTRLIEEKAQSGVYFTVLGFGMGNYKDATLEKLADKGNGNYGYIDTFNEARKLLGEQLAGTLITIAKDVKIQVEFNPAQVTAYRLIGYENRVMLDEDFNDDKKDAGDIGAGHTVTALYEIVPAGVEIDTSAIDPLKYQTPGELTCASQSDELLTVKLRYKQPDGVTSSKLAFTVKNNPLLFDRTSDDFQFITAVAGFGMLLRQSPYCGDLGYDDVLHMARIGANGDATGYREEFIELVQTARKLTL